MSNPSYESWEKERLIEEIISLKKRKKFGLVWEHNTEDVVERCKKDLPVLEEVKRLSIIQKAPNLPMNFIIEGDNYHSLSVLNYTHKDAIDVCYIDPPFNSGRTDWRYNNKFVRKGDSYIHSLWLSMMHKRLTLAKNVLTPNGSLICAIDKHERPRLELLLEEIFPFKEITCVSVVHNPQGTQGDFAYTHEYAIFVHPKGGIAKIDVNPREETLRDDTGNNYERNQGETFYPVLVENGKIAGFGEVADADFHPRDRIIKKRKFTEIWPLREDENGKWVERKWVLKRSTVEQFASSLFLRKTKKRGLDVFRIKDTGKPKTVWHDPKYQGGGNMGTGLVSALIAPEKFDYPKSLHTVQDALRLVVKKNSTVLDFFAGSGTTGHAVSILNKEDGGKRRFILCTNNDNDIARKVCRRRIAAIMSKVDKYPDITGIPSNVRYFKTAFVPNNRSDKSKLALTRKSAEMLCLREDTHEEVKINKNYLIYRGAEGRYMGIVYHHSYIKNFKKALSELTGVISVYVFSLADHDFEGELSLGLPNIQIKSKAIPKPILNLYRNLFNRSG